MPNNIDELLLDVLNNKCGLSYPAEYYDAVNPEDFKQVLKAGVREGLTRYAWWKDGTQYVGTTGTTLKEAIEEIENA